jgi:hypothetical protein
MTKNGGGRPGTIAATRAARVRALQQAVARGEYRIDAERVAQAIIDRARFHRDVLAALRRERPTEGSNP